MKISKISDNIVFIRNNSSKTAIIKAAFFAGTRFENTNQQGVSHLTEHLVALAIVKQASKIDQVFNYISDIDGLNTKEIDTCHIRTANEYLFPAIMAFSEVLSDDLNINEAFQNEKNAIIGAAKYDEDGNDP